INLADFDHGEDEIFGHKILLKRRTWYLVLSAWYVGLSTKYQVLSTSSTIVTIPPTPIQGVSMKRVTLIPGDGIGPEVVESAVKIIAAAGVKIDWDRHDAGESVFKRGIASGVPQDTIDSIRETRVVLKGPLGTPIGYGEKSANVTLRKLFETYGNLRP